MLWVLRQWRSFFGAVGWNMETIEMPEDYKAPFIYSIYLSIKVFATLSIRSSFQKAGVPSSSRPFVL